MTKKGSAKAEPLWLGYPDSNQERQDQNLQCYHYTIAQFLNAVQSYTFFRYTKRFCDFFC